MHFQLLGAAFWIEQRQHSWQFEIAKEDGEWFGWLGHWYVIFTPPGWKARRAEAGLNLAA